MRDNVHPTGVTDAVRTLPGDHKTVSRSRWANTFVPWSQVRLHLVRGQELQFPQPPAEFGQSAPIFELFSRSSSLLCHQLHCLV